jgi:hypothetical protein
VSDWQAAAAKAVATPAAMMSAVKRR